MVARVNVLFADPFVEPVERGGQAVQLLADILPYVLAKYRLAPAPASNSPMANRFPVRFVSDFQI